MQKFFLYSMAIVALVSCKQAEENKAEETIANNKTESETNDSPLIF